MNYKSISQFSLNFVDSPEYSDYVSDLINEYGIPEEERSTFNHSILTSYILYTHGWPIHDVGFKFILEYIKNHWNDDRSISRPIIQLSQYKIFEEGYRTAILQPTDSDNFTILITESQYTELLTLQACMDNDWVDYEPTYESLEEELLALDEEERNSVISKLNNLHIREASTDVLEPYKSNDIEEKDVTTIRFSGAMWFEEVKKRSITIAGLGGIGSWAALQLSRLNPCSITLYDLDRVDAVNLAGQFYCSDNVSMYKVDAVSNNIIKFSDYYNVVALPTKFDEKCNGSDIMICGFDNMAARKTFIKVWYNHLRHMSQERKAQCLFIDGRLSVDDIQVFCIRGDDEYHIKEYTTKYLFDDSEVNEPICSYKQTSYTACMIGSIITNLFVNFVTNSLVEDLRELPFLTTYDSTIMKFKIED